VLNTDIQVVCFVHRGGIFVSLISPLHKAYKVNSQQAVNLSEYFGLGTV